MDNDRRQTEEEEQGHDRTCLYGITRELPDARQQDVDSLVRRVVNALESFKLLLLDLRKDERDVNQRCEQCVGEWKETRDAAKAADVKKLLQARKLYRETLKNAIDAMQTVREVLDEGLAKRNQDMGGEENVLNQAVTADLLKDYKKNVVRVELLLSEWQERVSLVRAQCHEDSGLAQQESNPTRESHVVRMQQLKLEEDEITRSCSASAGKKVLKVVRDLRRVEGSLDFHSSLLAAQDKMTTVVLSGCDGMSWTQSSNRSPATPKPTSHLEKDHDLSCGCRRHRPGAPHDHVLARALVLVLVLVLVL
eukprot:736529-Hanusia_phi.AAC.1